MRKTIVDLSYYSFPERDFDQIITACYSTLGFLSELANRNQVYFLVRPEKQYNSIDHHGVHVVFAAGKPLKKWRVPWVFHRLIQSLHPDYILVHGFGSAPYLVLLKLLCPKAKILLQCNGFASAPDGLKKWVYKLSDRFIDGYLFTGVQNAASWYEAGVFRESKVFDVMEGSTHFKFNKDLIRKDRSYLWVANLFALKDPLTVLKAFDVFLDTEPEATLTMVYAEADLIDAVSGFISKSKKLENALKLQGFVPHANLEKVYNEHQFFISASHQEGSGYALVEAMACGCVPIVTEIAPHRYMTSDGDCALLYSVGDHIALLEKLRQSQCIKYQEWQCRVLHHFKNRLSFKAIAARIDQIFQSL